MWRDPDGSLSTTRIAAMCCVVTACVIALYGAYLHQEQAGTVAALLGGGAANFFARSTKVAP